MAARCPTCKREALPRAQNPAFPFCSLRCREVDLGKWLGEEYRLVDSSPEAEEDGQAMMPANNNTEDEDP
jgi:endogenous inhibitor of DNA gyrase (YacG/DUF329 family)